MAEIYFTLMRFRTVHRINATICIISGVWSIVFPDTMMLLFRARAWSLHGYDYAIDFLQAWGLFAVALGIICERAARSTNSDFQQSVAASIVVLTAASILWDLRLACKSEYGPFGFFAAALNLFLFATNALTVRNEGKYFRDQPIQQVKQTDTDADSNACIINAQ